MIALMICQAAFYERWIYISLSNRVDSFSTDVVILNIWYSVNSRGDGMRAIDKVITKSILRREAAESRWSLQKHSSVSVIPALYALWWTLQAMYDEKQLSDLLPHVQVSAIPSTIDCYTMIPPTSYEIEVLSCNSPVTDIVVSQAICFYFRRYFGINTTASCPIWKTY